MKNIRYKYYIFLALACYFVVKAQHWKFRDLIRFQLLLYYFMIQLNQELKKTARYKI